MVKSPKSCEKMVTMTQLHATTLSSRYYYCERHILGGQNGLMPFSPKLYSLMPHFPN